MRYNLVAWQSTIEMKTQIKTIYFYLYIISISSLRVFSRARSRTPFPSIASKPAFFQLSPSSTKKASTKMSSSSANNNNNNNNNQAGATEVQILTSQEEKSSLAPILAKLSSDTEMKSYGVEQWQYLLDAGDVSALIVPKQQQQDNDDDGDKQNNNKDLLGCVLRIGYGSDATAYGMMLVSPDARGQGLARKLLQNAMNYRQPDNNNNSMKILGTCTEMGRPFYEKIGYKRVSTVTRMTAPFDNIKFPEDSSIFTNDLDIEVSSEIPTTTFDKFLELDAIVTGLDRSKSLTSIAGYSYVSIVTVTTQDNDDLQIASLVTQHTGSSFVMVGPILGQEEYVPTLLQAIREHYTASSFKEVHEMALIVSDHTSLVNTLTKSGFQTAFELGAMTLDGTPLPGQRDKYLGLIHPTLG